MLAGQAVTAVVAGAGALVFGLWAWSVWSTVRSWAKAHRGGFRRDRRTGRRSVVSSSWGMAWAGGPPVRSPVVLAWYPTEPFTVRLTAGPSEPAESALLSRGLLQDGMMHGATGGQVQIRRSRHGSVRTVVVSFGSGPSPASVMLRERVIRSFLDRIDRECPVGNEMGLVNVDAAVEELIARGSADL